MESEETGSEETKPTVRMCQHLDEGKHMCKLMRITANTTIMDPLTKQPPDVIADKDSKARSVRVCGFQIPGWKRGALSCQVPEVEKQGYTIPYFKMYEVLQAATQVMNRMSQEPDDRACTHCSGTGTVTPPICKIMKATCPTPTHQGDCPVASKAEGIEDPDACGPKMAARLEAIYDKYYDKHMFTKTEELTPDSEDDDVEEDKPRRGRVSTPLQRMRDEGRA